MWIVCQIGAREHYAIPRALHQRGILSTLITDLWMPPGLPMGRLPLARRLRDRYHADLATARVFAPNLSMLGFELRQRWAQRTGWDQILSRNAFFQRRVIPELQRWARRHQRTGEPITLFSYSYAALELFRFAKQAGWQTVLGQIDPGPEEERIVAAEHQRYSSLESAWTPAPSSYWDSWRQEIQWADRILVNSRWSRDCLLKEDVPAHKMEVIPLVYQGIPPAPQPPSPPAAKRSHYSTAAPLRVLFLGQINLRKGMGRLLEAMRLLQEEPVELTLAGPTEINPAAWADLPKVHWIGPVPRSAVMDHYRAADVFILPTVSDGFALTQLECLSQGVPIIASRHCGEVVAAGQNGWLLDDLEPGTIAGQIRAILSDGHTTPQTSPWSSNLHSIGEVLERSPSCIEGKPFTQSGGFGGPDYSR